MHVRLISENRAVGEVHEGYLVSAGNYTAYSRGFLINLIGRVAALAGTSWGGGWCQRDFGLAQARHGDLC